MNYLTPKIALFLFFVVFAVDIFSATKAAQGVAGSDLNVNNQDKNRWYTQGVKLVKENLLIKPKVNTAKNSILFLGDGMGFTTITAARILDGQQKGNPGEENVLSWEVFPWTAVAKPYAVDLQGTDSASSATAFLSGIKTNEGLIGLNETVRRGYCSSVSNKNVIISILTLAEIAGMSTGIVTTTRITHATPASAYAHSPDRNWESDASKNSKAKDDASECKDIALQLVEYPYGNGIDVIFAGGRRELMHANETDPEYPDKKGNRRDRRNLIKEWLNSSPGSSYVWNKTSFAQIDPNKVDKVMGLFEYSHMKYDIDRESDAAGEPSIAEMTAKAIQILQKNPKGYFLLVEGGRIDHAHHSGQAVRSLHDVLAFDKAVTKALELVNIDETLVTITADHSHVFTIGGYPKRGNPIFDVLRKVDDSYQLDLADKTYTTLGYMDGPGGLNGARPDLLGVDTGSKDFHQQATVLVADESHGSEDIGVFADGPGSYLFHGVVEQQYVFHVIDHALCLSDSKQKTCEKHVDRGGKPKSESSASAIYTPPVFMLLLVIKLSY